MKKLSLVNSKSSKTILIVAGDFHVMLLRMKEKHCDYTWLRVIFKEPVMIVPVTGGLQETLPNSQSCSLFVCLNIAS